MENRSSRTPEGIPHRCSTCGNEFRVIPSPTGDACCPNCNTLVWPIGPDHSDAQPVRSNVADAGKNKEIRLRPKTPQHDVDYETKRAIAFLRDLQTVRVIVACRGRQMAHQEEGQRLIDNIVEVLVPEHGKLKAQPEKRGRRIVCTFEPY